MALRYVTIVVGRNTLLITATTLLLGLAVYAIVGQAWERSFAREAESASHSIAAAIECRKLPADFVCRMLPLGNIRSVRVEATARRNARGELLFDSRSCEVMDAVPQGSRSVVRTAQVRLPDRRPGLVAVSVWNSVRDRLGRDVLAFTAILWAAVTAFMFAMTMAMQTRYRAGIRAVTSQARFAPDDPGKDGKRVATFEELSDMAEMFQIVRECMAHDLREARESPEALRGSAGEPCATWESGGVRVRAFRLGGCPGHEATWAWRHDSTVHVLLARFEQAPAGDIRDFGAVWRRTEPANGLGERTELLNRCQAAGYLHCIVEDAAGAVQVKELQGMSPPHTLQGDAAGVVLRSAPAGSARDDGMWVVVTHGRDTQK